MAREGHNTLTGSSVQDRTLERLDRIASAQPCGCDSSAEWVCERHRQSTTAITPPVPAMHFIVPASVPSPSRATTLPDDPQERKRRPVVSGVMDYFPDAIAEVARVSWQGNEQHNPGQPLHWAREKSTDHVDCIGRHLLQRGTLDTDGMRHSAKMAWRALANLQLELEAAQKEGK